MRISNFINSAYSKLPDAAKFLGQRLFDRVPNLLIYGGSFGKMRAFLADSQNLSRDELREWQFSRLKKMVAECFEKSGFYRRFYSERGFSPADLKEWSDIEKIPLIDKAMIWTRVRQLAVRLPFQDLVFWSHTGGTSSLLHFPETMKARILERAFTDRMFRWHGLDEKEPKVTFKGGDTRSGRPWYYSPFLKSTVLPFLEISIQQLKDYSKVIQRIKPKAIAFSYPSLVYAYARAVNQGLVSGPDSLKVIFCSSESMLPYQKEEIEKAFGIVPLNYYGQNEKVALIQQCPRHESHIIPEYGITEILDQKNRPVTEERQIGEIVGTGFLNRAFPLVRYRTGDFAIMGSSQPCPCGLPYDRISSIEGRGGDFLRTRDGMFFSPAMLEFSVDHLHHVRDFQLIQTSLDQATILLCPDTNYEAKDGEELLKELRTRTKDRIAYKLTVVESIPRPANAKKRMIISELDQASYDFIEVP